jgi:type IV fimbrial biogenesis protein FimT
MDKTLGKWNFDEGTPGWRSGYTAIELMVVVALIAIITAIALPHFSALVDRWRVHQEVVVLQNVMRFATAQAIRTRSEVVIQAKPATCRSLRDAQNWSCGMMVFQDTNQNKIQDPDEPTLQDVPESHALTVIHAGSDNARLRYGPHGTPIANPGRFQVYPIGNPNSPAAQTICRSWGGRLRVKDGLVKCED